MKTEIDSNRTCMDFSVKIKIRNPQNKNSPEIINSGTNYYDLHNGNSWSRYGREKKKLCDYEPNFG